MSEHRKRKAWRLVYPENIEYLTGDFPWLVWLNVASTPFVAYGVFLVADAADSLWLMVLGMLGAIIWTIIACANAVGMVWMRWAFRNVSDYRLRKIQEAEEAAEAQAWMEDPGTEERIRQALKNLPD